MRPVKTPAVLPGNSLLHILSDALPILPERSVVAVTSKIVSVCENRCIRNDGKTDKDTLVKKEAEYFIESPKNSRYHLFLTIKQHTLIANAGIDESNGNGNFILWPENPAASARGIWEFLRKEKNVRKLGVIITDSKVVPMQWGTIGVGIGWCGFRPLKSYIGKPDIFGRNLRMTNASHLDGLAAAAVTCMGEGNEQTPVAVISDVPFVEFTSRPPSNKEIRSIWIRKEDDIYSPLTDTPLWQKGEAA